MRIGTGPSGIDLTAQHNLLKAFNQLNQSAARLSTMRRINSGSDDPAGLIAAEDLRAEITAIRQASHNAARARGNIRVADSAMAEVSNLLGTIRGNMVAAAGGGLSDAELDALQIENDAALDAINRIGNVTSFGGRNLLDGGGGFQVQGVNDAQITDVTVHANSGGGQQTPAIQVTQAAAAAELTFTDANATLDAEAEIQLSGSQGTVTLQFAAGATLDQIATAVNASSGNSGVEAAVDGNDLVLSSTDVGSDATVAVEVLQGDFDTGENTAQGTDVVVNVDGVEFTGNGNQVQIHTETLQADVEFAEGFVGAADPITISGEGMTFVFSPDVSHTSSIGLPNVNTAALGGAAGRLSDLASGGAADISNSNFAAAVDIIDSAQSGVLSARARIGAFEKYTIESSERVLGSMEVNLSSALSQIADTDVAAETSRMVQSQILVQAATSSLMLAGQSRGLIGRLFGG